MGNYILIVGFLLNSALIVINRFVKHLPDSLQILLLLMGAALMITGLLLQ